MVALPPRYRDDNYRLLLSAMYDDHGAEQRALHVCFFIYSFLFFIYFNSNNQERKQGYIMHLNSTQRHIAQLQAQKKLNIELLTDIKFKQFRDKMYDKRFLL